MSYYNEYIFQVWCKADGSAKEYLDETFFNIDDAKKYVENTTNDFITNTSWGYDMTFSFSIKVVYNPCYDYEQICIDEKSDYLSHID